MVGLKGGPCDYVTGGGVWDIQIFEFPDVTAKLGVLSLGRILEVGAVFGVPGLEIFSDTSVSFHTPVV